MKNRDIIDYLVKNNDPKFNLLKTAEELQELALALIQKVTKEDKYDDQKIIDEIGDVKIRMRVLNKIFDKIKVKERVNYKLGKFQGYIEGKTYKNIQ